MLKQCLIHSLSKQRNALQFCRMWAGSKSRSSQYVNLFWQRWINLERTLNREDSAADSDWAFQNRKALDHFLDFSLEVVIWVCLREQNMKLFIWYHIFWGKLSTCCAVRVRLLQLCRYSLYMFLSTILSEDNFLPQFGLNKYSFNLKFWFIFLTLLS